MHTQKFDSSYIAQLTGTKELKLQENAGKHLKEAMANLDGARRNRQRLASYKGGSITVADVVRWIEAFPPGAHRQIATQPDSVLQEFVEQLSQTVLMARQMDSAGVPVPVANWQALQLSYRATVDQLAASIGLSDSVVADSTRPKAERMDSAASRVNRYLDQLLAGQAQFRPLPGPLVGYLRENGEYKVNNAGLTRAVELATAKWKADSASGAAAPPQPEQQAPIQPAPGGPPRE
jgi:hypothetical protein